MVVRQPWSDDKLQRKFVADQFEGIQKNSTSGSVFLIHADFGMGKTYFVENWYASLIQRAIPVIHFDAWLFDYFENPLAAFISAINDQANNNANSKEVKFSLSKFSRKAAPILLKAGSRISLRLLSMGAIDGDVDTIGEVVKSEILDVSEAHLKELADSFDKVLSQRQFREDLRSSFKLTIDALSRESGGQNVIVLIDELDRCRPQFTLDLLEDIKHFLNVDGVQYFIFCDENVLQGQAEIMLGTKSSGEKYVQKFQTHRLRLPTMLNREAVGHHFLDAFSRSSVTHTTSIKHQAEYFANISMYYGFSLRQAKQIIQFGKILSLSSPLLNNHWPLGWLLLSMRDGQRESYNLFLSGQPVVDLSGLLNKRFSPDRTQTFITDILCESSDRRIGEYMNEIDRTDEKYGSKFIELLCDDLDIHAGQNFFELRSKIGNQIESLGSIVQ